MTLVWCQIPAPAIDSPVKLYSTVLPSLQLFCVAKRSELKFRKSGQWCWEDMGILYLKHSKHSSQFLVHRLKVRHDNVKYPWKRLPIAFGVVWSGQN